MDSSQESARHFVRELIRATGWTASKLAKEAGMSHTTLSRFLNNDRVTHTLSLRTIDRLRTAAEKAVPRDHIDALWIVSQRRPSEPLRRQPGPRRLTLI